MLISFPAVCNYCEDTLFKCFVCVLLLRFCSRLQGSTGWQCMALTGVSLCMTRWVDLCPMRPRQPSARLLAEGLALSTATLAHSRRSRVIAAVLLWLMLRPLFSEVIQCLHTIVLFCTVLFSYCCKYANGHYTTQWKPTISVTIHVISVMHSSFQFCNYT